MEDARPALHGRRRQATDAGAPPPDVCAISSMGEADATNARPSPMRLRAQRNRL